MYTIKHLISTTGNICTRIEYKLGEFYPRCYGTCYAACIVLSHILLVSLFTRHGSL